MGDHLTVDFDSDEGDYTDYATDAPLPTPSGTPYRTPHPSRLHSRHATPSPTPSPYPVSSSPPTTNGGQASPLHRISTGHHHQLHHHDRAFDESISILDPRRFTPTLHANLVAEILSLRRELESKSNLVDTLEQDLHAARNEHETAATSAVTAQREARDFKRQLARAENDDAVEAVAKERDDAVNSVAELKRQVERLTKSRRSAEEDVERIKKMAEQDNEEYEASKRALERRAHIAEGRLKTLLDELAVANSMPPPPPPPPVQEPMETDHEDATQSEVEQSDATSVQGSVRDGYKGRPASWKMGDDEAERLGIRFSVAASTGKSLADELNFDEDGEDEEEGLEEYEEDGDDDDDRTAEFSVAEDNTSAFAENASDSGLNSEVEGDEEECEMTEYHEMGVQVDFDDALEQEDQKQENEQEKQLHQESEQQVERLDILGLEIEEKLAELERTYVELDRKTVELDGIYNEVNMAHDRIYELEEQIDKMDEEASEREEVISNLKRDHAEERKVFEARGKEVEERWTVLQTQEVSLSQIEKTLDKRSEGLDEREALVIAASTPIVIEENTIERSLDERSKSLDELQICLNEREVSLNEWEVSLNEWEVSLNEQEASLNGREASLNEQGASFNGREASLNGREASLNGREVSLGDRERHLDEQKSSLDQRETDLAKQKTALNERKTNLDEQEMTFDEQKTSFDEREKDVDEKEVALEERRSALVEQEKKAGEQKRTLDEQKTTLDEQKTTLDEQKTTLDEQKRTLDEQKTTLDEQKRTLDEQKMTLDEQKIALNEREKNLDEQSTALGERGADLDERETELDDQVTTIVERKSSLDRREMNLNEHGKTLKEWEANLDDMETTLEERQRSLGEREELVAASTPIAIENKGSDTSPAEIEAKEYEANERRKRSRSTGVSSPIPFSSPVATFSAPVYVSCESQTTPSYASAESQTSSPYVSVEIQASPIYVSVEAQARPVYVSVEAQARPAYVSVEAQACPAYVSVEAQACPAYVSVEAQARPAYVSVEAQITPPYVSAEVQTSSSYVSAETQTSSSYVSVETQCSPSYVSVDSQTIPPYVSVQSQVAPVYASTKSQTDESTPPPIPPRRASPPLPPPVTQTQTVGVQTDPVKPPPLPLIIPTIAVIPPPPTPPLPPPPPPTMKNAAVQTRSKQRARNRSMQTEEIRLDERIMKLPPHLHPSAIMANNPAPNSAQPDGLPPSPPKKSLRRSMVKRTSAMGPTSVPASGPAPRSVPIVDDGPGFASIYNSPPRVRAYRETPERDKECTRRQFNGVDFHDIPQSSGDEFLDDADLSANEFKTALSAPKPKKLRNSPHINLNRPLPVETALQKPAGGLQRKGATIRKTALISSGSQAHNRARSPSFESSRTSESGTKIGPPFPVPTRHSSRKPGGYGSQPRNESPTPMSAALPRKTVQVKHTRQQSVQSIRKVRSATALPNLRTSNGRNRSPPPLSASSAAPDSPQPLHRGEMRSSAFGRPKFSPIKHKNTESTSNSATTAGTASVGSAIQQTSVVDAIAQTMVGEWMWKYVRRRKSFGVAESPQNWDSRDESAGGQRHKRWVWLAPYERAVMWSSRQPTSGNALLGKSGRKRKRSILQPPAGLSRALDKVLTSKVPIQSVLDVKDDTPLPKSADPAKPLFNRSILILTPARALKFTAPNKERHYVWLTALSFLSHSPQGGEGLLALPPPMPFEYEQVQHQQPLAPPRPPVPPIPMHRDVPFHPVRDSIRLAKGKERQKAQKMNGFPPRNDSIREVESVRSIGSVAEPPSIPRFPGQHTRKRSNSAVRPGTQRSISNGYDPSVLSSYGSSNNGDYYGNPMNPMMGVGGIGIVSEDSSMLSGHPGAPLGGWDTEPVGTVRMEAFVERSTRYEFDDEERRGPSSYRLRNDRRSSRQESYWSGSGDFYAGSGPGPVEDEGFWRGEDPFGGF